MNIEILEVILVLVIIALQISVFVKTFNNINLYKTIVPDVSRLKISVLFIPLNDLERLTPKEILENTLKYKNNIEEKEEYVFDYVNNELNIIENKLGENKVEVNIIEIDSKTNYVFEKILFSINNYLIRNRGASSDFNLIKDIVDRNTVIVEEEINQTAGIPLYLGLMATMMGIIIALFNMPDLNMEFGNVDTGQKLDEGIGMLIGGVKIAMIASFTGLLLTIINTGFSFKGAKSFSEVKKNDFYTFIQIELLPIINQGLASTLESLQRNLFKFNDEFSTNLKGLSGIFDSNIKAIEVQKELLETIDKAKISEITRYNVKVLQQLDLSVSQFEKFNSYLTNVNLFVENSQNMVSKTNELLERTDNFKFIADNLEHKFNESQKLLDFLSMHFIKLEEHKQLTSDAVANVGFSISDMFNSLKEHIGKSTEAVKEFTIEEVDLLRKALSEGKTNLGNLEHLATLKTDVSQFKNLSSTQGEKLQKSIEQLNENILKSAILLEKIENNSLTSRAKDIGSSIKNLFKSEK